jgi:hypothetical protein
MDPRDQLVPFVNDTQGGVTCVLGTQAQGGSDIGSDFHLLCDFLSLVRSTFLADVENDSAGETPSSAMSSRP